MEEAKETSQDRIQSICDKIRWETLQPAQTQAEEIIAQARQEGEKIIKQARKEAEEIKEDNRKKLVQEKLAFQSSLEQASKQTLESLKQTIERDLFHTSLDGWIQKHINTSEQHAQLIDILVQAIDKEGIKANLEVIIPQQISSESIVQQLAGAVRQRIQEGTVSLGNIQSGVKIKLEGRHVTIDLSQEALKEIFFTYVRKDFRKMIFGA